MTDNPAPPIEFRSGRVLSRWIRWGLAVQAWIAGAGVGTTLVLRSWYSGESAPVAASLEAVAKAESYRAISSIVILVVIIVLWVIWLYRSYKNVEALGLRREHKQFWVWLGWFVPIWNLFRPWAIHREVWLSGNREKAVPIWMMIWWFLWLVSGSAARFISASSYTWADVIFWAWLTAVSCVAIPVVGLSTDQQDEAYGLIRTDGLEAPPPSRSIALSFGSCAFAALLAVGVMSLPDSTEVDPESESVALGSVAEGDCFATPISAARESSVLLIDCDLPHDMQVVGTFDLPTGPFPGDEELTAYSTVPCLGRWLTHTGGREWYPEFDVLLFAPDQSEWGSGDRSGLCVASRIDGESIPSSLADPESAWVPLEEMRVGECYEFHDTLLVARPGDCAQDASAVSELVVHDEPPGEAYPGADVLLETLGECALDPESGYVVPTAESWEVGDRVSICITDGVFTS